MKKTEPSVLSLSKTFSSEILKKLRRQPDLKDAYIGGSISRYEALPMSDVDIVYFGPTKRLKDLNLEKIDRVDNFALTDPVVERLFTCVSPEVGFLDSRPIDGEVHKLIILRPFVTKNPGWPGLEVKRFLVGARPHLLFDYTVNFEKIQFQL